MVLKILIISSIIIIAILYSKNNSEIIIETNKSAPVFSAIDHNENEINIKDYIGQYVVLYFFPKAFTPGWTKQACGFRDQYSIYQENNISVIGVSYDSPKKLNKFREKHKLPFIFISDNKKEISRLYNSGGILFPSRKTIIINPKGNILEIIEDVNIATHSKDIIDIIINDKKQID